MTTKELFFAIAQKLGKFDGWHTTVLKKSGKASSILVQLLHMVLNARELPNALFI